MEEINLNPDRMSYTKINLMYHKPKKKIKTIKEKNR